MEPYRGCIFLGDNSSRNIAKKKSEFCRWEGLKDELSPGTSRATRESVIRLETSRNEQWEL